MYEGSGWTSEPDESELHRDNIRKAMDLSKAEDPDQAICSILDGIIEALDGDTAFFAPIEEGEYIVRYLRGEPFDHLHQLKELCRLTMFETTYNGQLFDDEGAFSHQYMLTMVRTGNVKRGLLGLLRSSPDSFSRDDEKELRWFVGLISLAVSFRSEREKNRSLEASYSRFRKNTEWELLFFQTTLDSLPVGVILADKEVQITDINSMAYRLLFGGVPTDEFPPYLGRVSAWNNQTGDPLAKEDWPLYRTIALGRTVMGEVIDIVQPGGTSLTLTVSSAPLIDKQFHIQGGVMVLQDVTAIKEAEKEIVNKAKELARSNADLQQFAYAASHDLQEPLRMVSSYLTLLERQYGDGLDPNAKEYIGFAVQGSIRMRELINGLLEYSRVETKGREFALTDMNEAIGKAILSLKTSIDEKEAIINVADLPIVLADQGQMVRLFQNLISNSIKFNGNVRPQVDITVSEDVLGWCFRVRDNGIGIDPKYSEKIFEVFSRLHTAEEYPGTGIGLAICKRIIDRHCGRIWVESEEGKGATFSFTLPKNDCN